MNAHPALADRTRVESAGPATVLTLPTTIKSVVSFEGSFLTQPDFAAGDELLQELAVSLLDKGTRRRNRFELAEVLESRGAQVGFHTDQLRIGFSGRVLREHLSEIIEVVAEELREPAFDAEEFEKTRARLIASYRRTMENTGARATDIFSRALYAPDHPNHARSTEQELERLEALTLEEVRAYYESRAGSQDLALAFAGDLEGMDTAGIVAGYIGKWSSKEVKPSYHPESRTEAPGRSIVHLADKANVDVRIGQGVALYRGDEDWMPLFLGLHAFGGNFSARLMSIIRDQMGLTYGIYAGLAGVSVDTQGHWYIGATLSRERLEEGIRAIRAELDRFAEAGITEEELDVTCMTVAGSFQVSLGTTAGLASNLLHNWERGFQVAYLDQFAREVLGTGLDRVNEAIRRYIHPESTHEAIAGTVD